jgi:MerR family transcriptional regulator, redox-sensitive transcriptional activator SoxR
VGEPMTIGELAAHTGVPASTLRYYDRIGLVPATGRSGGQRRYDAKVIGRVRAVTLCQRSGFTPALECGCRRLESCGRAAHLATLGRLG